jgi:hypothetical protein
MFSSSGEILRQYLQIDDDDGRLSDPSPRTVYDNCQMLLRSEWCVHLVKRYLTAVVYIAICRHLLLCLQQHIVVNRMLWCLLWSWHSLLGATELPPVEYTFGGRISVLRAGGRGGGIIQPIKRSASCLYGFCWVYGLAASLGAGDVRILTTKKKQRKGTNFYPVFSFNFCICISPNIFIHYLPVSGVARAGGGGKWCGRSGRHSPRGDKMDGRMMNILNEILL